MTLRKANSYSKKLVVPYTRKSKTKGKDYIKAIPPSSLVKFTMGNLKPENLKHYLRMISLEKVQVRHNALESCRQYLNKKMDEQLTGNYYFKVLSYPHHVQRENKMLTGAGADRMQTGMQLSFGKAVGTAAIVYPETPLFFIAVKDEKDAIFVREIFNKIKAKLPCKTRILHEIKI